MSVWVINIFVIILLAITWLRWSAMDTKWALWYIVAMALKITCGILVGLYYRSSGGGDTWLYYEQARILSDFFRAAPMNLVHWLGGQMPMVEGLSVQDQPRSLFFVTIVALLSMATGGGYWLVGLYFSVFNFFAAWYLVNGLATKHKGVAIPAAIAFLFFPSVLFWGSGVLKESLANGALFVLAGVFIRGMPARAPALVARLLLSAIMVLLLWRLRYFYAATLIPVALAYVAANGLMDRTVAAKARRVIWYAAFFAIWTGAVFAATRMHYNLRLEHISSVIYHNYAAFVARSEPGRFIRYPHISPEIEGVLRSLPRASFSGVFRPNVWEYTHPMQIPLILENALMLAALIALAIRPRSWGLLLRKRAIAALWFAWPAISLLAMACPNFGSLVRYRSGALAFIVFLLAEGIRRVYFAQPTRATPAADNGGQ